MTQISQNLFLEFFSEEIPARMQKGAMENLISLFQQKISKLGLSYEAIECHSTPRRLVLYVKGLPEAQEDYQEERRGPRQDADPSVISNFLKAVGQTKEQCEIRQTPKGSFYFASIAKKGQKLTDCLPALITEIIYEFSWPKSMRWARSTKTWVRPLISGVCLFGNNPLMFHVKMGEDQQSPQVPFGSISYGHRFLSEGSFSVESYEQYRQKLLEKHVVLDRTVRAEMILSQAQNLASKVNCQLRSDPGLLEEVVGLIEYPFVYLGKINPEFMHLPAEVLTTSMRVHQRYLCLEDAQGNLAPYFIIVANTEPRDHGKQLIIGNERVLKARLSDAQFFYEQDQKVSLFQHAEKLERLVFQDGLGSIRDKALRLQKLAAALSSSFQVDPAEATQAAFLAKADLVTEMVGEFPELQGIMGKYYAQAEGLSYRVSQAIAEHYLPKGGKDALPAISLGQLIALIDRLDTLVGFFSLGIRPTGSKDPHALRRLALAVIRILEQHPHPLDLKEILKQIHQNLHLSFPQTALQPQEQTLEAVQEFIKERLKVYWREENIAYDVLAAVLKKPIEEPLYLLKQRCLALQNFLKAKEKEQGALLLNVYRRACNIIRGSDSEKLRRIRIDPTLFEFPIEQKLVDHLTHAHHQIQAYWQEFNFVAALQKLKELKDPVDAYFDTVTINTEDEQRRLNRWAILAYLRSIFELIADFAEIVEEGEEK